MRISIIVAMAENGVIGRGNQLPWNLPGDLKYFKAVTLEHPIIMGRKTWESLPKKPLPQRLNIVVTRDTKYNAEGALVVNSLKNGLEEAQRSGISECFIIGGATVYKQALPIAERLYLTAVHDKIDGDVHFPPIDLGQWLEVSRDRVANPDGPEYSFVIFDKRKG